MKRIPKYPDVSLVCVIRCVRKGDSLLLWLHSVAKNAKIAFLSSVAYFTHSPPLHYRSMACAAEVHSFGPAFVASALHRSFAPDAKPGVTLKDLAYSVLQDLTGLSVGLKWLTLWKCVEHPAIHEVRLHLFSEWFKMLRQHCSILPPDLESI